MGSVLFTKKLIRGGGACFSVCSVSYHRYIAVGLPTELILAVALYLDISVDLWPAGPVQVSLAGTNWLRASSRYWLKQLKNSVS